MQNSSRLISMALIGICLIALTGCVVSQSTLLEAQKQTAACEDREKNLQQNVSDLTRQLTDQTNQSARLQNEVDELNFKVDDLIKKNNNYQDVLTTKASEQQKLNLLLKDKVADLEAREKKIEELQSMIARQKQIVNELMAHLKNALVNFTSDELTIEIKNGKVYVAMSDQLLFSSGSTRIDQKGQNALGKLAEVLRKQPDIDIVIEGHTDSVPIKTSRFKDNWDLSVMRATSVLRVLTENHDINPKQLIPSGRGEHFPVASNDTAEGRARNRRTEIILSPNLDELFSVIQGKEE